MGDLAAAWRALMIAVGPSAPFGGEASMEATIGIALVIVSLALMLVISRTVIANTPKA